LDLRDHHYYTKKDIENIINEFNDIPEPKLIVTTEKDTTKLISLDSTPINLRKQIWILPIGIKILQDKENIFNDKITGYVQKNLRNRRMAKNQDDDTA
jgi:tetraacyldisaccharide 4'-kinase